MSHAEDASKSAKSAKHTKSGAENEATQVTAFLRNLAERAERDPTLAQTLAESLNESGLLPTQTPDTPAAKPTRSGAKARPAGRAAASSGQQEKPLDPFALYRAQGEAALRAALEALDLEGLRAVVKAHRIDPARISSRWTARERVITLIIDQVKARLNHGRAFERV